MRYLAVCYGPSSGQWLFVCATWNFDDAVLVASRWFNTVIYDLLAERPDTAIWKGATR